MVHEATGFWRASAPNRGWGYPWRPRDECRPRELLSLLSVQLESRKGVRSHRYGRSALSRPRARHVWRVVSHGAKPLSAFEMASGQGLEPWYPRNDDGDQPLAGEGAPGTKETGCFLSSVRSESRCQRTPASWASATPSHTMFEARSQRLLMLPPGSAPQGSTVLGPLRDVSGRSPTLASRVGCPLLLNREGPLGEACGCPVRETPRWVADLLTSRHGLSEVAVPVARERLYDRPDGEMNPRPKEIDQRSGPLGMSAQMAA